MEQPQVYNFDGNGGYGYGGWGGIVPGFLGGILGGALFGGGFGGWSGNGNGNAAAAALGAQATANNNADLIMNAVGNVVIKRTGDQQHCYHVAYKDEKYGELGLVYAEALYVEEVYYEKQNDDWTYVSTTNTPIVTQ